MQGNTSVELSKPNPLAGSWLSDKAWGDILGAAGLDGGLAGVDEMLEKRPDDFRALFNSQSPKEDIISLFGDKINALEVLILLRCLRPDKVVPALQDFIAEKIGNQFIEPPPFDLRACYNDSTSTTPLLLS